MDSELEARILLTIWQIKESEHVTLNVVSERWYHVTKKKILKEWQSVS